VKVYSESFGESSSIEVGDMVYWTKLGLKYTGVISAKLFSARGGRQIVHATVFCFETQKNENVLAINLKRITKNDEEAIEN